MRRPLWLVAALVAACLHTSTVHAQVSDDVVRIGVLNDQSGLYADAGGPGTVVAARMAAEDAGGSVLGKPVEIVFADHQNKSDIGAAIARKWFETGKVDMAIGFDNSAVALAVEQLAAEQNRIAIAGAVGTHRLHRQELHAERSLLDLRQLRADHEPCQGDGGRRPRHLVLHHRRLHLRAFAGGRCDRRGKAAGGKVLGSVRHPLNTADFSSYLLQAQASGAKVVAFANGGGDMINATKQANEFGLTKNQTMVSLLVFISDVHSMELQAAQGLKFVTAFYWDRDDETRAWSKRFFERQHGCRPWRRPALYSAVRHYLAAIAAAGTDEAKAVMAKMRECRSTISTPERPCRAKTAGWCTTCISRRSKRRRNRRGHGTTTRSSRPSPAIRRSVRSPKAAARWWRRIEL